MTPAEHLRAWCLARRTLLNPNGIDRAAGRATGTFARFLAGQPHVVLRYGRGIDDYANILRLLGYVPPKQEELPENG